MSIYKKKKMSSARKRRNNSFSRETEDYAVNSSKTRAKRKNRNRLGFEAYIVLAVFVAVLLIVYAVFISFHPIGLAEYSKTLYRLSGNGDGFDIDISGGKPSFTISNGKSFFLVTDSAVNGYNLNGKNVFSESHTFSSPVVVCSETRSILYGQGETDIAVYNLSGKLFSRHFEKGIVTTAISKSGVYAVATKADGYDSVVSVFDKKDNMLYEWYSSSETVNALALSDDGKTLAVATLSVKDGRYNSSVYVLRFDSADPIMKTNYTDETVYRLSAVSSSTFSVVFCDKIDFVNFKKGTTTTHESEYSISIVKEFGNKTVVLRTVAANQDDSVIEIYKSNGELHSSFNVHKRVTDFSYNSGKIYLLSLGEVEKYNTDGKLLAQADTGYDSLFLEVNSENSVICVRNSVIEKISLIKSEG